MTRCAVPTDPSFPRRLREWLKRSVLVIVLGTAALCSKTASAQLYLRETPVGSWQTSLSIPAFGSNDITVLLSFTADGITIETDTPTAGPVFFGSSALGNGHGAWRRTGRNTFDYLYVKEIYAGSGAQGALGAARSNAKAALSCEGKKWYITHVHNTFTAAVASALPNATGTGTATRIAFEE